MPQEPKGAGAWGTLETQDYSDLKDGSILYLGYLLEGERVTLTNGDDADETQKVSAEAYVLNEEVLAQAVEILSKNIWKCSDGQHSYFRNLKSGRSRQTDPVRAL